MDVYIIGEGERPFTELTDLWRENTSIEEALKKLKVDDKNKGEIEHVKKHLEGIKDKDKKMTRRQKTLFEKMYLEEYYPDDFYIDIVPPIASISISQNAMAPDFMELYISLPLQLWVVP